MKAAWQSGKKNATGPLFLFVSLTNSHSSSAAWPCLLCVGGEMLHRSDFFFFRTSHCRHLCPFFSSPAAFLSPCLASALFTLFKFLPLSSPLYNILSSLFFLCPDQFSSPFSQPLRAPPPLSHPPSTLQPPYVSPVTLSSSVLCSSSLPALAKWQKEAVGGLASCISYMHYSCALQSVWVLVVCWLFTGTHGPRERALCAGHRVWWRSCTDGTTNFLISALRLSLSWRWKPQWVSLLHRSTFKYKRRQFSKKQECLFCVSHNSTGRLFTTKPSGSLFFSTDWRPAKISVKSPLMLLWETCPCLLLAKISVCLAAHFPRHHIGTERLFSLLFRARPVRTVNWTGWYEILI